MTRARRAVLGLASAAALVAVGALLVGFVWPAGAVQDSVDLGVAEEYEPGSVTMHEGVVESSDLRWGVQALMDDRQTPAWARNHEVTIALARHDNGSFSAFIARDPRTGCPLAWRTNFLGYDPDGVFRDPCYGSTYDEYGLHVFGPSPRAMDFFDVMVDGSGHVIVDLRELHPGCTYPDHQSGSCRR